MQRRARRITADIRTWASLVESREAVQAAAPRARPLPLPIRINRPVSVPFSSDDDDWDSASKSEVQESLLFDGPVREFTFCG
jgi:hypothetical protein